MMNHDSTPSTTDLVNRVLSVLKNMPEEAIKNKQVGYAIADFWRKHIDISVEQSLYLGIWDRIWLASTNETVEAQDINDPVGYAINDTAGKLTEELFKYLWPKDAKVGGGLPKDLTNRVELIVGRTDHERIDASSVIVASRIEILHAVDPKFTKRCVLPLLKWDTNPNAAAYWSAFLWPARISPDLYKQIETDCITALNSPGRFQNRTYETLCQLFLLASMELKATSDETVIAALDAMGIAGLEYMSSFIRQRMLNSKEDASNYWSRIVKPWLQKHWPRDAANQSPRTMENFAMTGIYSDDSFPKSLEWLENNGLLGEVPTASTILYSLKDREERTHDDFKSSSTLVERFPKHVVHLLWLTKPFQWDHGYAREVIDTVGEQNPALRETEEYMALSELIPQA